MSNNACFVHCKKDCGFSSKVTTIELSFFDVLPSHGRSLRVRVVWRFKHDWSFHVNRFVCMTHANARTTMTTMTLWYGSFGLFACVRCFVHGASCLRESWELPATCALKSDTKLVAWKSTRMPRGQTDASLDSRLIFDSERDRKKHSAWTWCGAQAGGA